MLSCSSSHPGPERLLLSGSSERPAGIEPFTFQAHPSPGHAPSTSQGIALSASAT